MTEVTTQVTGTTEGYPETIASLQAILPALESKAAFYAEEAASAQEAVTHTLNAAEVRNRTAREAEAQVEAVKLAIAVMQTALLNEQGVVPEEAGESS